MMISRDYSLKAELMEISKDSSPRARLAWARRHPVDINDLYKKLSVYLKHGARNNDIVWLDSDYDLIQFTVQPMYNNKYLKVLEIDLWAQTNAHYRELKRLMRTKGVKLRKRHDYDVYNMAHPLNFVFKWN